MPATWIAFARRDVLAADVLQRNGIYEESCFHSQQAAEKALKAFLLYKGQTPPRIHALPDLLTRCLTFDTTLNALRAECTTLNQYYAPTRDPDAAAAVSPAGLPGQTEAQRALDYARAIISAIETRIVPSPPSLP
jgi:HEPN domain-containing protein